MHPHFRVTLGLSRQIIHWALDLSVRMESRGSTAWRFFFSKFGTLPVTRVKLCHNVSRRNSAKSAISLSPGWWTPRRVRARSQFVERHKSSRHVVANKNREENSTNQHHTGYKVTRYAVVLQMMLLPRYASGRRPRAMPWGREVVYKTVMMSEHISWGFFFLLSSSKATVALQIVWIEDIGIMAEHFHEDYCRSAELSW